MGPGGRTTRLVELALTEAAALGNQTHLIDLHQAPIDLCDGRDPATYGEATLDVIQKLREANGLVVATPVYRASYSSRLKNLFDLLPQGILAGKPVALAASGGSLEHRLSIDYALRPLLAQFGTVQCPASIYCTPADLGSEPSQDLIASITIAIKQLCHLADVITL